MTDALDPAGRFYSERILTDERERPSPARQILNVVRKVIGRGSRELQRPRLTWREVEQVSKLHAYGEDVHLFEAALRSITGATHAIAVNTGTAALHLALVAAGVGAGMEVLCPALTFAATANAIVHTGATPHFVDVRQWDLGVNPFLLRQYLGNMKPEDRGRIKAFVPVHLLGAPCEVETLKHTCAPYGITVIEDAAEALGTKTFTGLHAGTVGKAGILSFNANKIVTTGGGGAVLTDDEILASTVRHLASQAKVPHPFLWEHDAVGYNARMPYVCAALGYPQLCRLQTILKAKQELYARYADAFAGVECCTMVPTGNGWLNAIILDPRYMQYRDDVLNALIYDGFEARALFTPLYKLPHFANCPRQANTLHGADDLFRRVICLPSTTQGDLT